MITKITHCKRNHEYTPENTRMSNGTRKCRTCEHRRDKIRKDSGHRKIGIRVSAVLEFVMETPQECKKCGATGHHNFFHDLTDGMESFRCRQCGTEHYAYDVPLKTYSNRGKYSS